MFPPVNRALSARAWLAHALCITLALSALSAPTSRAQSAAAVKPDTAPSSTSATMPLASSSLPVQTSGTLLRYCSAFASYQRLNQQTITPWRSSNDAVLQAGGWRELAKQARSSPPDAADKANDKASECPPGVAAAVAAVTTAGAKP